MHGRSWARLAEAVPTKTLTQIKNYYQNYKVKVRLRRAPPGVQPAFPPVRAGSLTASCCALNWTPNLELPSSVLLKQQASHHPVILFSSSVGVL